MEPIPPRMLEAVRRLRAGKVKPAPTTNDPRDSEMIRVVSAASLAWRGQLDRLDRFSLPLLPSGSPTGERANATTTSQLFLEQTASDYRRVASPHLDLREVEAQRKSDEGRDALRQARVANRSVAPLVVGQYLASREASRSDLASVLEPWIFPGRNGKQAEVSFGKVLGPMVHVALDEPRDYASMKLPDWSSRVGALWCKEFLIAGSEILKDKRLLGSSRIEGLVTISSHEGLIDAAETINNVVALAEAFRPVEDVRVRAALGKPQIDLFLSGKMLDESELTQLLTSVDELPADVFIVPTYLRGEGSLSNEVEAIQPDELES